MPKRITKKLKLKRKLKKEFVSNRRYTTTYKDIKKYFRMQNNFPIFMAITDIAWFRPDIINPASPVPTGIGAVAYLDLSLIHI